MSAQEEFGLEVWLDQVFNCQRQLNEFLKTITPKPSSLSLQNYEQSVLEPIKANMQRLSSAIADSSNAYISWWYEAYDDQSVNTANIQSAQAAVEKAA